MTRIFILVALTIWTASIGAVLAEDLAEDLTEDLAEARWEEVSQIFSTNCINCHSSHGAAKGLRLDSYDAVLAGGVDGLVVLAGDPFGSELIKRLRGDSAPRMPFLATPLPPSQIDLIVRWIEAGMPKAQPPD